MGKRGPAPKPTELRVLQGVPGHRPLNKQQPRPDPNKPICPAWLDDKAKTEWRYIAPLLYDCGLLKKVDRVTLAGYCVYVSQFREATEQLQKEEVKKVYQNHTGNYSQNPWIHIQQKAWDAILKSASRFGMSPSDRTSLVADEEKPRTLADVLMEAAARKIDNEV